MSKASELANKPMKRPGEVGRPTAPKPPRLEIFLPARRTSLIKVNDRFDVDELHEAWWEERDLRDNNKLPERPHKNAWVLVNLVAQGRFRLTGKQYHVTWYVKDPNQWTEEAIDFRTMEADPGTKRCNYCGDQVELEDPRFKFVGCRTCLELLGFISSEYDPKHG